MNESTPEARFTPYGPDHFAEHLPFGRHGYLFAVPGSFSEDTPAHTNVTDWLMAVYRIEDGWEVRDVNGNRQAWGTGGNRRTAVGLAFLEIARLRRLQATEIARRRVQVLGLEAVPPYAVEVISSVTLVLAPNTIGILDRTELTGDGPACYHVRDINGGKPYEIRESGTDGKVTLRTTTIGVLHARCGCDPEDVARFESEPQALIYAREALTVCRPCTVGKD
ncbi:hypothetical protein [Streptomyces sp. NBC_01483]|uniref:hypothetical protein n=1 Tax=Streptomyces sp. NBC_01483 TaxID=2903883 RepID=UPI002E309E7C|nr:hypothetical protein [Streptomyces sp. NBC_01483]